MNMSPRVRGLPARAGAPLQLRGEHSARAAKPSWGGGSAGRLVPAVRACMRPGGLPLGRHVARIDVGAQGGALCNGCLPLVLAARVPPSLACACRNKKNLNSIYTLTVTINGVVMSWSAKSP